MPNEIYLNADGSLEQTILDGLATWVIQTIASGAITFAQGTTLIDTQSSAATDDLDTISFAGSPQQGEQGTILFIKASNGARTVVVKHMTGNIYNPCLTDIKLDETAKMLMLVHDGTRWVVMAGGCGGAGETVTPIVIGDVTPGNEVPCVAAARMVEYLKYIINAGKAKISNTRLEIVEALAGTIAIVQPDYSSVAVMALAATFDTTYADAAAVDVAFTTVFYDAVRNVLYCADANDDGVISVGELAIVYSELTAMAVVSANIIASLIAILGAAGLSNAVGVSTVVAATCSGCAACDDLPDWVAIDPTWAGWAFGAHGEYHVDVLQGTARGFVVPIGYTWENYGTLTTADACQIDWVEIDMDSDGDARSVALFDMSDNLLVSANPAVGRHTTRLTLPIYYIGTEIKVQTQATNVINAFKATWVYSIRVHYV